MPDNKDSNPENMSESSVVSIDQSYGAQQDPSEIPSESPQQPLGRNNEDSMRNPSETHDLLRAIQTGDYPTLDKGSLDHEIPVTAAGKSAETRGMIEELAGEQSEEEPEEEDEIDNSAKSQESLPDLEIKATDQGNSDSKNNREPYKNDKESESKPQPEEPKNDKESESKPQPQQPQQPQQMLESNLGTYIGHAVAELLGGVLLGVGRGLGAGWAELKKTQDTLDAGPDPSVPTKVDAGANSNSSPAGRALNDSFNEDKVKNWKKQRIESGFVGLQMDVDSHLSAIDRLKQTDWGQKLKSIEASGDMEMMAKVPAILNIEKAKSDFKDADHDMNFFLEHIQQRAERLSSMVRESSTESEKLNSLVTKWEEDAKKSLDKIPESKEGHGFIDNIQNVAKNILSGIRSMFVKPSSSASMG